jgi:hypothetical protein
LVTVPPSSTAATATAPAALAGVVTRSSRGETTVRAVPAVPPNVTDVTPSRCSPVIVTTVPPAWAPDAGETVTILAVSNSASISRCVRT